MDRDLPELIPPPRGPKPAWKKIVYPALVVLLLALAVLSPLLPLIPGPPLVVVALIILGTMSERVRRAVNRLDQKLSAKWRQRLRKMLAKIPRARRFAS
jgi:uncharacterized membrane protein YbaN (DUF454 family)